MTVLPLAISSLIVRPLSTIASVKDSSTRPDKTANKVNVV